MSGGGCYSSSSSSSLPPPSLAANGGRMKAIKIFPIRSEMDFGVIGIAGYSAVIYGRNNILLSLEAPKCPVHKL